MDGLRSIGGLAVNNGEMGEEVGAKRESTTESEKARISCVAIVWWFVEGEPVICSAVGELWTACIYSRSPAGRGQVNGPDLAILTLFSVRMWGNRPPTFPVWFFSNMVKDLTLLCRCADKQKRKREREREKKKACFFFQPKGKAQTAAALTQLAPPSAFCLVSPPRVGFGKMEMRHCVTVHLF